LARKVPRKLVVLKLGGSLITNKDVPLSVNKSALTKVGRAINQSGLPNKEIGLILIHGGGSFGHYYAKKFHLSREPKRIKLVGITRTSSAMLRLHSFVIESLLSEGVATETIQPSELLKPNLSSITENGLRHIRNSLTNGLVPISFGGVGITESKAFVISGDDICKAVATTMKVGKVIFAMDVDGVYADSRMIGKIIPQLSIRNAVDTRTRFYDVTGGLESKLRLGFELRNLGAQVFYVNGNKPDRLANLLTGRIEKVATEIVS
jgi:isopentenyl phosphate kinase